MDDQKKPKRSGITPAEWLEAYRKTGAKTTPSPSVGSLNDKPQAKKELENR